MPEYSANKHNVSATHTGGGYGSAGEIYCDGKIFTGYYQNWKDLSKEERDKVMAERERLGIKPKARGRSGRGCTACQGLKSNQQRQDLPRATGVGFARRHDCVL